MGESFAGLRAVARALIVNADGRILLCRSRSGKSWVLPGGTLDLGETLPQAAAREAEEEAGLAVTPGPLVYLQEFRPAQRPEHVLEAAFLAEPAGVRPAEALVAAGTVRPAGPPDNPWGAWFVKDVDGPLREVRWVSRAELAALPEPVFPVYLRKAFWERPAGSPDPYLGLVLGK